MNLPKYIWFCLTHALIHKFCACCNISHIIWIIKVVRKQKIRKVLDTKLDDYNQDHKKCEEKKNGILQHNIAMLNINITFIWGWALNPPWTGLPTTSNRRYNSWPLSDNSKPQKSCFKTSRQIKTLLRLLQICMNAT